MPIVDAEFDAESIPYINFARENQFHAQLVGSKNRRASLHVAGAHSSGGHVHSGEPHFLSSLHERPGAVIAGGSGRRLFIIRQTSELGPGKPSPPPVSTTSGF